MQPTSPCNRIQERIVASDAVDEIDQAHVLSCASCGAVAAEWLALDTAIADGLEDGLEVPAGFADRVMAAVAVESVASSRIERLLGLGWLRFALANIGLVVAVTSVLRFVFSTLLPATSLGGVP